MRLLLTLVLALLCGTMQAAIYQNTFTTNQNSMGTAALVSQSNNLLGVNNTDTNTFLRSGGTGSAPYFSVLPGSSASSPVNNFYATNIFATNVTVVNLLTVSNISVTNITVQNNLTVSNLYTVNGNHNTMIVTNALSLQTIKTNVLVTDGNGTITNMVYGTGLTWTPSTRTLSASGGGGTPGFTISSALITANLTNIDGGTLGTNAFVMVGGSGSAITNGFNLTNAYFIAKSATPHGLALATSNRFTILLLPGVFDLGTNTLFLTANYVDVVGISPNTGTKVYYANWAVTEYGDTVIKSARDVIDMTAGGISDVTIANVCINPPGATYYGFKHNGTSTTFKMINVLFNAGGFSGGDRLPMTQNKDSGGYWEDVRSWYAYSFSGYGFVVGNNAIGTFVRCRASTSSFGQSTTGTFIDCVEEGTSTGDSWGKTSATGTYIRCQGANSFVGTFAPALMRDCYFDSGADPTITGGTIINSTFGSHTLNSSVTFGGLGSTATTTPVNIAATGWTNTFGKQAVVYFDGTAVTATVYNNALTAMYTNAVALTGMGTVILQPSGKVILSGTSVTGRAVPF